MPMFDENHAVPEFLGPDVDPNRVFDTNLIMDLYTVVPTLNRILHVNVRGSCDTIIVSMLVRNPFLDNVLPPPKSIEKVYVSVIELAPIDINMS